MFHAYRTVYVSLPHILSEMNHWRISMSCKISTSPGVEMFGMLGLSYFSSALCAPLVTCNIPADIRSIRWFFSTLLSPSALLQTAACRGRVFPCYTNDLQQYCRHFTSVQWKMCWVECHWFCVTWVATHAIPYHTSTGELYPLKQLQIQDRIVEQEVVFSRSTSGCGATGEHFPARSQYLTL